MIFRDALIPPSMKLHRQPAWLLTCLLIASLFVLPDNLIDAQEVQTAKTVEQLAANIKPSLVTISTMGRDGKYQGVGTGFVVDQEGLIVTNLHVIGDSREFRVETASGEELKVIGIHASDRVMDLAIIRVQASDLTALAMGDINSLAQGAPIIVMGNPHGLRNSVVSGINSGIREIDGRKMMQLAIPIEPGNSGGPVLDMQGNVHGIVTMKSLVTANLGFAVDIAPLKALLDSPNPVTIDKWLTIGSLDPRDWEPVFGPHWKQRGGRILAGGSGAGFAGRSLCLYQGEIPEIPYEIQVRVKLDDEKGAAGLIFFADGRNKHYGFYPTNNKIRFTLFEGSSVFTWTVLYDQPSDAYRPREFNTLKVRVEEDRFKMFVNGQQVLESTNRNLTSGKPGLAKFRETAADFRNFVVAKEIDRSTLSDEAKQQITDAISEVPPLADLKPENLAPFLATPNYSRTILQQETKRLEDKLTELKKLDADIHTNAVAQKLGNYFSEYEKRLSETEAKNNVSIDLLKASLIIASVDEDEINIPAYLRQVDRMVADIKATLVEDSSPVEVRNALNKYLYEDNGFHGARFDYYHRANSYMNRLLDDREGLPITLSVLYMELGTRLGLKVEGVGIPGHFIVRQMIGEKQFFLDPFDDARILSLEEVKELATNGRTEQFDDRFLETASAKNILMRMLNNLLGLAQDEEDKESMLRYLEVLMALDETHIQNRGMRAIIRFETGRKQAAVDDLDYFLDTRPNELDLDQIQRMRDYFNR